MPSEVRAAAKSDGPLGFLWVELTDQCNLRCVHCYADSGPERPRYGKLVADDYRRIIKEASDVECESIQFIGGEPTLHKDLPDLIQFAAESGMKRIEIYTNLVRIPDALLRTIERYEVHLATSVYADTAETHDRVTTVPGSFERTVGNIKKMVGLGIPVRVGIVSLPSNYEHTESTLRFVLSLGVENARVSSLREFGRANGSHQVSMSNLCGACAANTLCVSPSGRVSPCIMSKAWDVGDVSQMSIGAIAGSARTRSIRKQIGDAVLTNEEPIRAICDPKTCCPATMGCEPCPPYCTPTKGGCNPCIPKG
jgi:pyruvate-formate lyase-activating enzyme